MLTKLTATTRLLLSCCALTHFRVLLTSISPLIFKHTYIYYKHITVSKVNEILNVYQIYQFYVEHFSLQGARAQNKYIHI